MGGPEGGIRAELRRHLKEQMAARDRAAVAAEVAELAAAGAEYRAAGAGDAADRVAAQAAVLRSVLRAS